jgi:hypothetical protein
MASRPKGIDKGVYSEGRWSELAKPFILPIFVAPSALIALAPFRYLWNNPPSFVGKSYWLAILTPVVVDFVVTFALSYLMTVCWRLWKPD